jgi:peptidoglycan/xylan/chitin deacetylase (PgdA/CDA1 family)
MPLTKSSWKGILFRLVSSVLFYSKGLKVTAYLCNRLHLQRGSVKSAAFPFIRKTIYRNVQVLAYHRVNDDHDPFFPGIYTEVFARRMSYIAANYNVLSLNEAVEMIQANDIPDNALVVTFDDGYRDNYTHAFPILKDLSIPATIFLATDAIDSKAVLWHDRVFCAFRETQCPVLANFGPEPRSYSLKTLEEKLVAQRAGLEFLWSLNDEERQFWVDCLVDRLRVCEEPTSRAMLSWDEVRIMHRGGITFGSHTASHPILSKLSPAQLKREVSESKKTIEEKLGAPVKSFAYPVGRKQDLNVLAKTVLRETGYLCALTTIPGVNGHNQDLFELRRGGPWEVFLPGFALKLQWEKFQSQ